MRYSGKIGFAQNLEVAPGVYDDVITEREYFGDLLQRTEAFNVEGSVLPQYRTNTSVSVLLDGLLVENYDNIRYISLMGKNWTVSSVVFVHPRITLFVGEVYGGPTAD